LITYGFFVDKNRLACNIKKTYDMDKNRKPNFIITLLRTSTIFNLYVLSNNEAMYGIFGSNEKELPSGVFTANKAAKNDYRYYVEIDLVYGDFDLNKRSSEISFSFEYSKPLNMFGEEALEGYAKVPSCNPERCKIEKVI
jgi:hypothetical protein